MDEDMADVMESFDMAQLGELFAEELCSPAGTSQTFLGFDAVEPGPQSTPQNNKLLGATSNTFQGMLLSAAVPVQQPALPPSTTGDPEAEQLELAVVMHPLYPRLMDAITKCRKVGVTDVRELHRLDERCRQARDKAASIRAAVIANNTVPAQAEDPELSEYLERYIEVSEQHHHQLVALHTSVDCATRALDTQINDMISGRIAVGSSPKASTSASAVSSSSTGGGVCSANASGSSASSGSTENLRKVLKRQYADQVNALQEEFSHRRKIAKLPEDATCVLRQWFNLHYTWPYPSDDDKEHLSEESGLQPTQVSNWFINQRKRHWSKLFTQQPINADQAAAMLLQIGLLAFELPQM